VKAAELRYTSFITEGWQTMRIPRVYIETSVFNFYFADNDPEKQRDTLRFFAEIREGKYEAFTSDYVLRELARASEPKRSRMISLIEEYAITILPLNEDARVLADAYVAEGVIPKKYLMDGIHIAMTAVFGLNFIVSLNFEHIVKRKTIDMTGIINYEYNYQTVGIFSPTEVIENEN
jgi:predicted nucleic acid-binding protein